MSPLKNPTQDHVSEESDAGEQRATADTVSRDVDSEFGGREARLKLERKLVCKLDARMSILILIYILNYVRLVIAGWFYSFWFLISTARRSTGIMHRASCNVLFPTMAR
jgi:hypothetical protein